MLNDHHHNKIGLWVSVAPWRGPLSRGSTGRSPARRSLAWICHAHRVSDTMLTLKGKGSFPFWNGVGKLPSGGDDYLFGKSFSISERRRFCSSIINVWCWTVRGRLLSMASLGDALFSSSLGRIGPRIGRSWSGIATRRKCWEFFSLRLPVGDDVEACSSQSTWWFSLMSLFESFGFLWVKKQG